ncbi:hypothetical protein JCM17380_13110 [Desulfosporosinus burensis]
MAVTGFNVGNTMSLGEMGLALDYLENKDSFEPDLEDIKEKITSKKIGRGKENNSTAKEIKVI